MASSEAKRTYWKLILLFFTYCFLQIQNFDDKQRSSVLFPKDSLKETHLQQNKCSCINTTLNVTIDSFKFLQANLVIKYYNYIAKKPFEYQDLSKES